MVLKGRQEEQFQMFEAAGEQSGRGQWHLFVLDPGAI
jgi:hypothetical protein